MLGTHIEGLAARDILEQFGVDTPASDIVIAMLAVNM